MFCFFEIVACIFGWRSLEKSSLKVFCVHTWYTDSSSWSPESYFKWRHCEFTSNKPHCSKSNYINVDSSTTMTSKQNKTKKTKKTKNVLPRFRYTGFFIEFVSTWKHAVQLFLLIRSCLSFELGATLFQSIWPLVLLYHVWFLSFPRSFMTHYDVALYCALLVH